MEQDGTFYFGHTLATFYPHKPRLFAMAQVAIYGAILLLAAMSFYRMVNEWAGLVWWMVWTLTLLIAAWEWWEAMRAWRRGRRGVQWLDCREGGVMVVYPTLSVALAWDVLRLHNYFMWQVIVGPDGQRHDISRFKCADRLSAYRSRQTKRRVAFHPPTPDELGSQVSTFQRDREQWWAIAGPVVGFSVVASVVVSGAVLTALIGWLSLNELMIAVFVLGGAAEINDDIIPDTCKKHLTTLQHADAYQYGVLLSYPHETVALRWSDMTLRGNPTEKPDDLWLHDQRIGRDHALHTLHYAADLFAYIQSQQAAQ